MSNSIKLSELEAKLRKAIEAGYGDTIKLIINGEEYTIIKDAPTKKVGRGSGWDKDIKLIDMGWSNKEIKI